MVRIMLDSEDDSSMSVSFRVKLMNLNLISPNCSPNRFLRGALYDVRGGR